MQIHALHLVADEPQVDAQSLHHLVCDLAGRVGCTKLRMIKNFPAICWSQLCCRSHLCRRSTALISLISYSCRGTVAAPQILIHKVAMPSMHKMVKDMSCFLDRKAGTSCESSPFGRVVASAPAGVGLRINKAMLIMTRRPQLVESGWMGTAMASRTRASESGAPRSYNDSTCLDDRLFVTTAYHLVIDFMQRHVMQQNGRSGASTCVSDAQCPLPGGGGEKRTCSAHVPAKKL